jgi:hypothetical protein
MSQTFVLSLCNLSPIALLLAKSEDPAHAETRSQQEQVIGALEQKCAILWAQLDAIDYAYVAPGNIPPGCFAPQCD